MLKSFSNPLAGVDRILTVVMSLLGEETSFEDNKSLEMWKKSKHHFLNNVDEFIRKIRDLDIPNIY